MSTFEGRPISELDDEEVAIEVGALLEEAGPDERRVVCYLLRRLVTLGQRQYGLLDLKADKRDHVRGLVEELADAVMYVAFHALTRMT